MDTAKLCLIAAGCFFLVGLLAGAWKYLQIRRSPEASASRYVDLAHRASLMYAFANGLLAQMVGRSAWPTAVNVVAVVVLEIFFGVSVAGYLLHGALGDTDNQFRKPHRLGKGSVPGYVMTAFMTSLIGAEIGAFLVILLGFLWS